MNPTYNFNTSVQSYPSGMVMANTVSGGALIFLLLIIVGAIALILLITSLERYSAFFKMFDKLINSIKFTILGVGVVVVFYAIFVVCTILAEFGSGVNPIHIGLGICAYALITLLGWGAWKVVIKFGELHEQYRKKNPLPIKEDGT
jgi:hypothetical protein